MENPNPYNDAAWSEASMRTIGAIEALWEAGASIENIEQDVESALENAGLSGIFVSITVEGD